MMLSAMWSADDLAANRRGEMSVHQKRTLRRRWGGFALGATTLAAAMVGAIVLVHIYAGFAHESIAEKATDGIPGAAAVFLAWYAIHNARRLIATRSGQVIEIRGRYDYGRGPDTGELGDRIGDHLVVPIGSLGDAHRKDLRAYLLPRTKLVIAIETQ